MPCLMGAWGNKIGETFFFPGILKCIIFTFWNGGDSCESMILSISL